jgi:hypothetical protein
MHDGCAGCMCSSLIKELYSSPGFVFPGFLEFIKSHCKGKTVSACRRKAAAFRLDLRLISVTPPWSVFLSVCSEKYYTVKIQSAQLSFSVKNSIQVILDLRYCFVALNTV